MASSINGAPPPHPNSNPHCSVTTSAAGRAPNAIHRGRTPSEFQENHHHQRSAQRIVVGAGGARKSSSNGGGMCIRPEFPTYYSIPEPKPEPQVELGSHFCGRKSTRFVSKMHFGRPKICSGKHSKLAEVALEQVLRIDSKENIASLLTYWSPKLSGSEDYAYILRELGNKAECKKALQCFEWAVSRERRRNEQGKLLSIMISILGRHGRAELARQVFEKAKAEGYGNTVFAFSALISAYGRSGLCKEAVGVFESMKRSGCKPNLVSYNAIIDAFAKGSVDFKQASEAFDEMIREGVQPDRITFNSLLSVCSRGGLWEEANGMFEELLYRGIDPDIFTYNTLLDALCKGGQMDLAAFIMSGMPQNNIWPNVVTYSTVIDGYAKAGRLDMALNLYQEMKYAGIDLDRVSYNTLLSIYAKLGRFDDCFRVCEEMEKAGFKKDTVTYNALLGGYGKQGRYNKVKSLFEEMKAESITPNVLTYSTLIDIYSKGGLQVEAMHILNEFEQAGLKPDVVLYSALIDALCKNGSVEEAVALLDKMTKEGITPNIVTYNSIIDAFGRSGQVHPRSWYEGSSEMVVEDNTSDKSLKDGANQSTQNSQKVKNKADNALTPFGQLGIERTPSIHLTHSEEMKQRSKEILCTVEMFHKMHELGIKPNVVTFSAILNACSRCQSFEEASVLLEKLYFFDSRVYGVAHGLLMGFRERVWGHAQELFDEVTRMDSSTASAFYNALTDMLWHFGQRRGAQLVVLEGKHRHVWENAWRECCLDLHLMSAGAAQAMLFAWLLSIRSILFEGRQLPRLLSILTGWGKHSKIAGNSTLKRVVEALLVGIGAPFHVAKHNEGRFTSTGPVVGAWLRESGTMSLLVLHDEREDPTEIMDQFSRLRLYSF